MRAEAESLADALAARKVIERAKGLLMEKEQLTEQEAFARLRKASQASGRPLKVIAEAVVATLAGDDVTEEHPNAALMRRVFAAFGSDAKAISAAFDARHRLARAGRHGHERRVPRPPRGRRVPPPHRARDRRHLQSQLHTVFANDEWAVAVYRAWGTRNGVDLDVEQALVIRFADGMWKDVTAVPLDAAFDAFWS